MSIDSDDKVQDLCSIVVLTDDQGGTTKRTDSSQLALSSYLTVQESKMCTDAQLACQTSPRDIAAKGDGMAFCSCNVLDVDIEKGNLEKVKINGETGGSIKTEIAFTKALRRQNSLQPGGEATRPFMNHILMLLKLDPKDKQATERAHDAPPNNRWRKYKRPASFDSRQIVLLFSILSSMGTIVLIYLTLRVRQGGEGFLLV